ncbi:12109_t:CDS:2, partial [Acaulospora morrowiae]
MSIGELSQQRRANVEIATFAHPGHNVRKPFTRKYSRSLCLIGPSRKTTEKEKGSSLEFRPSRAQPPMLMFSFEDMGWYKVDGARMIDRRDGMISCGAHEKHSFSSSNIYSEVFEIAFVTIRALM